MKTSLVAFICSVVLCLPFPGLLAQAPSASLLKDINTEPGTLAEENDYEPQFCACGDYLYFSVANHIGTELWRTDGTAAGTVMVKDIWPGPSSAMSTIWNFSCVQNKLLFFANDGVRGTEPWISDGTESGTQCLKDIRPGAASSPLQAMRIFNGKAYFTISTVIDSELWQTDGTEAGTVLVKSVVGHSFQMASTDEYLYFAVSGQANQLWRTDGTTAGTIMLMQTATQPEHVQFMAGGSTRMYFTTSTAGYPPRKVWVSDGSEAGTVLLQDLGSELPTRFYNIGDNMIFSGGKTWWTDGTPEGTFKVNDQSTIAGTFIGDKFYGVGSDLISNSRYLYSLSIPGLAKIDLANLGEAYVWDKDIVVLNNNLLVPVAGVSTGAEMGTFNIAQGQAKQLKDISPGSQSSNARASVKFKGKCFFLANDGVHGSEIWMTDGTEGGTVLLKDINTGTKNAVNAVANLTTLGDDLFFLASESQIVKDIWKSNGTEEGTQRYHDFTGIFTSIFVGKRNDELIYFQEENLYKINGQSSGMTLLKDVGDLGYSNSFNPNACVAFGDKLLIQVNTGGSSPTGLEYWITDGTASGTHILKDIMPGGGNGVLFITGAELGNKFIFYADDGVSGREVWTTDGTEAGTVLLKDVYPGAESSYAQSFVRFGDQVLFTAIDATHGPEIWKTDGTNAGTTMITDVFPVGEQMPRYLTKVGNTVMFAGYDATNGWAIWKTDGTAAGTAMVKDVSPGNSAVLSLSEFKAIGDKLYFVVTGGNAWVSDGTEAGTKVIVEDTGTGRNYIYLFTDAGGLIYYKNLSGLWKMNASGTHKALVSDLQPIEMLHHKGVIYFTATSASFGAEVFKAPVTKFDQSINFDAIETQQFTTATYTLNATATSGLPLTFTSADDKVTITGNTVTFLKPGLITITAKQPGDGAFLAATEVTRIFCVIPPKPVIAYTNPGHVTAILSSGSETGNQWFRDNVKLESETSQLLETETSGSYTVQVSIDGCTGLVSDPLEVIITGTEIPAGSFSVYPNPAKDVLRIQAGENTPGIDVEIFDVHGKKLACYRLNGKESVDHPVSTYSSGMYLLRLSSSQGVQFRKWIKE